MCSCSTKRENIWSSWPIAAFKVCLHFLCMCYFCANFSCSKQTLISLPCCHTVFSSPPVHLHTRAHKGRVHVIHIWVAARFIFIHYCNILEAVQAILFILTTVTTFPIYLYSTHFVTHYQSIYTNLSSAINIIGILLGIYSSSLEYRVWQKRSERLCPSCQEKLLTAFPRWTCHIENVMG